MELDATPRGTITLKRGRVLPLAMHHPWVFTDAVGELAGTPRAGDLVEVHDPVGRFIGRGYFSPKSKIPVKIFSWRKDEVIDTDFWRRRLKQAVDRYTV